MLTFLSIIYLCLVVTIVYFEWPKVESINHTESIYDGIDPNNYIVHSKFGGVPLENEVRYVEMPNGHSIPFNKDIRVIYFVNSSMITERL